MKATATRLAKLEQRLKPPPPAPVAGQQGQLDFAALIQKIEAETARVEALPPIQKIRHYQLEMVYLRAKHEKGPPPDKEGVVRGLAQRFHDIEVVDVERGFPSQHFEMRRCEIALLREAGYPTAALEKAIQDVTYGDQWVPQANQLPPDGQALVDKILLEYRNDSIAKLKAGTHPWQK